MEPFEVDSASWQGSRAIPGRRNSVANIPVMEEKRSLQSIPDDELLRRLAELTSQSRRVEADLVAHIAEVDRRKLYARSAFPSMIAYCTGVLHLSNPEAYLRIAAARASREHPMLLGMLADGRLHLTAIGMLAPHLTRENRDGLLERAVHKSKRQIEELVAQIAPRPDAPEVVRKLPERKLPTAGLVGLSIPANGRLLELDQRPASELDPTLGLRPDGVALSQSVANPSPAPPVSTSAMASRASSAVVEPLSPGRYKVQFTASAEFHRKLERLRALASPRAGNGDLAAVIEQAVTEKLERLEARRFAKTKALRKALEATQEPLPPVLVPERVPKVTTRTGRSPSSRYIPAAVRRAVYERAGGRCCYVDEQGRRCPERERLEFHHRHPFGLDGAHSVTNIGLVCRAHNGYLADCDYGREKMASHRRPRRQTSPAPTG